MRYVYRLVNVINQKVYIGQTKKPAVRKANHFYAARKGVTSGRLYAAMRKHGIENFIFEIIEECEDHIIDEREQYWVSHYDSFNPTKGYNATLGGQGTLGCDLPKSLEHRKLLSEINKRRWLEDPASPERRQLLAERNRTDEARQISRETQDRRWSNPVEREEQRQRMIDRSVSDETRQQTSESMMLLWQDPSYRAKMKKSFSERPPISDETRQKHSERMTGKKRGPYKNKGVKQGPRQTSVTCPTCKRTMKFISKRHKCV